MTRSKPLSRSRIANRKIRRQQLIDATIKSIAEHGITGTTLETVTKGAKLSHGIVNFHFESKEDLYDQTLGYLAREHYALWYEAMVDAGSDPVAQLTALINSDFSAQVASTEKLSVWYAFWGQAKYRPNYLSIYCSYDEERFVQISRLCAEIVKEGGYHDLNPRSIARSVEAMVDGLWLSMLLFPKWRTRELARQDAFAFLATVFPRHFDQPECRDKVEELTPSKLET